MRQSAAFELPGPRGKRFDYLAIDEDDHYLLSAHLGAELLHVIDLRTNTVVRTVSGVPNKVYRAFLSCEGNDVLTVFDLDAHRAIAHLPTARGADVVMFDPGRGRIYVACSTGAISVFQMDDPTHFRKLADVAVEPKIHSLAVDPRSHRVYAPAEQEQGRPPSSLRTFQ